MGFKPHLIQASTSLKGYFIFLNGVMFMGIKALLTYNYGKENIEKIKELGYDIRVIDEKSVKYSNELEDIEVLVCYNPFETLDITKMKKLKWIQLSSAGIDQLSLEYVKKRGIIITNNKGGYSIPMGEWIVLKILELIKHSEKLYDNQRNKVWEMDKSILELYGRTIGFVGTGNIATEAAKRLTGFGVKVMGMNTDGRSIEHFHECVSSSDIDRMLSISDFVVITIPYTIETHHFINEDRFNNIKNGAYIVNVARGSIIDEKVLIRGLREGKISGAALDVVENEPLDRNSPLWEFPNVILTPHNSWVSEMRNHRRFNLVYDNMKNYMSGKELINVVNLVKGY
jgi:phosphoglycerate dehydrogenase-like enzyme